MAHDKQQQHTRIDTKKQPDLHGYDPRQASRAESIASQHHEIFLRLIRVYPRQFQIRVDPRAL